MLEKWRESWIEGEPKAGFGSRKWTWRWCRSGPVHVTREALKRVGR